MNASYLTDLRFILLRKAVKEFQNALTWLDNTEGRNKSHGHAEGLVEAEGHVAMLDIAQRGKRKRRAKR